METNLFREQLGEVLRGLRTSQQCKLRDISARAHVSIGYLSEVERGQKEASSETLSAIVHALNVPLPYVLRMIARNLEREVAEAAPDQTAVCSPLGKAA